MRGSYLALAVSLVTVAPRGETQTPTTEAPAGFDGKTNGFTDQTTFEADREVHQSPIAGGISQVTELRAGYRGFRGEFREPPGGSLINDRSVHADVQERVPDDATVRALRASLNTLGDGFVEALADETLVAIAEKQARDTRGAIAGEVVRVPVLEAGGALRVGRFGWKNQHASLVSFSADAYLNEMGITSPLEPAENSSLGRSVAAYDAVADPEDDGADIEIFARFMRSTKAPPRDEALAQTDAARAGSRLFEEIGCAHCHVTTMVTAPAGAVLNGGAFVVPDALGDKVIHPFGDFLLHDVGTGDGIVQNGGRRTASKMRTAPLWGLRTRTRFMHDGESLTMTDAILRHRGEASSVTRAFRSLRSSAKAQLLAFLSSL